MGRTENVKDISELSPRHVLRKLFNCAPWSLKNFVIEALSNELVSIYFEVNMHLAQGHCDALVDGSTAMRVYRRARSRIFLLFGWLGVFCWSQKTISPPLSWPNFLGCAKLQKQTRFLTKNPYTLMPDRVCGDRSCPFLFLSCSTFTLFRIFLRFCTSFLQMLLWHMARSIL